MGRPGTKAWLGRNHTKATRKKISGKRIEMYAADPSMAVKISEEMKRNWKNPETKVKMLAGLEKARANSPVLKKGRHLSEETKRRIGEAQKKRFAARMQAAHDAKDVRGNRPMLCVPPLRKQASA